MPRISIVIPAYNAGRYIAATLQSACASTFADFELLVIDDGSSDDTAERASGIDPRIKVLSQANAGMSASRNRGVAAGDSEFIALLDSDDLWHPDKLRHQVERLTSLPDHDLCFTDFTFWYGDDSGAFMREPRDGRIDPAMSGWVYHHLILENHALPSSVLLRRSAWNQLGPFRCDDQKTDDWEYLVRASRHHRFLRLAQSYVLYRQVPTSLSKGMSPINAHEGMRESLIARFGLQSPDGTPVDQDALTYQRWRGAAVFADAHCARGRLGLGLREFGRLLAKGPNRINTVERLGKSLFRRAFPKS